MSSTPSTSSTTSDEMPTGKFHTGGVGGKGKAHYAKSARAWCFTLNNYSEDDLDKFKLIECNFIIIAKETGESGTPHLQGVIRFKRTYRMTGLRRNFSDRAHWEPADEFEAAVNYCMKEDEKPFIKDHRKQGQRNDLTLACETIKTGGIIALARDDPATFVKYHGGFAKLAAMFQEPRSTVPHVTWLYGCTGSGKTRYVHDKHESLFVAHSTYKWWDGYRQQEAILIDDMRASYAPFNILLKIFDRYPMQVEVKGAFTQLNSPYIYVTSQYPPDEVYNREARSGEDIKQLFRRISKVIRYTRCLDGSIRTTEETPAQSSSSCEASINPYFTVPECDE